MTDLIIIFVRRGLIEYRLTVGEMSVKINLNEVFSSKREKKRENRRIFSSMKRFVTLHLSVHAIDEKKFVSLRGDIMIYTSRYYTF